MKSKLNTQSQKELIKTLKEKRDALQSFKATLAGGKAKNVKEGRDIKKFIAQIMTALSVQAKEAKTAPTNK